MDNQDKAPEDKQVKKPMTDEQLQKKMKALEKAVARKKELAQLRKAEKDKIKADIETKIREPKVEPKAEEPQPEQPKPEKKKKTRIIEKIVEEPESSSSEEEVIERIIVKKVPRQKPVQREDNIHDIIEKTNKEILMEKMKDAQKKRAIDELFSW